MLEKGQKYQKDGVIYRVKSFNVNSFHIKLVLINESNNQELKVSTTITNFTSTYSKIPTDGIELTKSSPG